MECDFLLWPLNNCEKILQFVKAIDVNTQLMKKNLIKLIEHEKIINWEEKGKEAKFNLSGNYPRGREQESK